MTKIYLLRRVGDIHKMGDNVVHFHGCPFHGSDENNLDVAKTFKSVASAKATNAFKYDGYEVVEAKVTVELVD